MQLPGDGDKRVSPTRVGIWVLAAAIGLYMVVTGVMGALSSGG